MIYPLGVSFLGLFQMTVPSVSDTYLPLFTGAVDHERNEFSSRRVT